jgi:hypothetical protein
LKMQMQIQYEVMPTELIKLHTYSQQHIHNRTRTICYSREKMSLAPITPEKSTIHEKCMKRSSTSITLLQPPKREDPMLEAPTRQVPFTKKKGSKSHH